MSLLNNMLNDLEKRQATAGAGQPLSKDIFLSSLTRKGSNGPMLLMVLVAVAAGVGVWVWINNQKPVAQPPVAQMTAANTLPEANPVPVTPVPAAGNESSPAPPVPVTRAAATEAVAKPSKPPTGTTRQTAKPETAVRKDSASTAVVASTRHGNAKVAGKQAATKPVTIAMANGKATPNSPADLASSFKVVSPQQRSDNFYRQAISLLQQSRDSEAMHALRQALGANPANHNARQLLAGLLVDAGRNAEASTLLQDGLNIVPGHSGFSMALARLQFENGTKEEALSTLEQGLTTAGDDAEYHAFLAVLLQNKGRHGEAAQHYITALRSNPSKPNWLIGAGISLRAENKMSDAAEAFQRAIDTGELPLEVAQFADQQLKEVHQQH